MQIDESWSDVFTLSATKYSTSKRVLSPLRGLWVRRGHADKQRVAVVKPRVNNAAGYSPDNIIRQWVAYISVLVMLIECKVTIKGGAKILYCRELLISGDWRREFIQLRNERRNCLLGTPKYSAFGMTNFPPGVLPLGFAGAPPTNSPQLLDAPMHAQSVCMISVPGQVVCSFICWQSRQWIRTASPSRCCCCCWSWCWWWWWWWWWWWRVASDGERRVNDVVKSQFSSLTSPQHSVQQQLCRGYMWNKIISKLFQPASTSVWDNFISGRGIMRKIISETFQRIIAAHEYFPTCSTSLK